MRGEGKHPRRVPPVRKRLGQHFLNDTRILTRVVEALELEGDEVVIEIGPGRGSLTALLLPRARRVVAIEYDRALARLLAERYAADERLTIVQRDVLDVAYGELAGGPFVLVGNVPYYITTPILFKGLTRPRPERAVYLVQREVAERIIAAPGGKEYGALSVNVQAVASAEILFRVPAGAFRPPPKVESAAIRIVPNGERIVAPAEEEAYRTFVIAAFGFRRKQMRRVIRSIRDLDAGQAEALLQRTSIDPSARPETLTPRDFARLLRESHLVV